jgi:hypothetical protein
MSTQAVEGPEQGVWQPIRPPRMMNSEQIQSLEVLLLAILPVGLLWWLWIRMLRW